MIDFDRWLFLILNFDGGGVVDSIAWFLSNKVVWAPLYIYILYLIYLRYNWRGVAFGMIFIGLGVGVVDQVCNLFKDGLQMFRPTHDPVMAGLVHTVRDYIGGPYGTVSAHAATTSLVAIFSSSVIRLRWFVVMIFVWTLMVSYSRIYLGVHYPYQVALGLLLGISVGLIFVRVFIWLNRGDKRDEISC